MRSNIHTVIETGVEIDTGKALVFDIAKVLKEEKYDGYYSIVTSEINQDKMP